MLVRPLFPLPLRLGFPRQAPQPGRTGLQALCPHRGEGGWWPRCPRPWGFESHWPCFTWASRRPSSPPLPCPALYLHNCQRLKSGLFLVFRESGSPGEELHPHSCSRLLQPSSQGPQGGNIVPATARKQEVEAATGLGGRADIHREDQTRVRLVLEGRGRAKMGGLRGAASRVAVRGGLAGKQSGLSCRGSTVRAGRTGSPGLHFGAVRTSFPPVRLGTRGRAAASCLLLLPAGREDSLWLGNRALSRGVSPGPWLSVGQVNYPKVADSSSFDEDSSDALSPEQPASHESQGSVPSPLEARVSEPPPSATSVSPAQVSFLLHSPGAQTCWSSPCEVSPWGQVGQGSREVLAC